MRSRRSFFNSSVLFRDITRFFPVWGIFTILAGLFFLSLRLDPPKNWDNAASLIYIASCWILAPYALMCALTLFGDLYQSRLCNALHALPLRREGWFFTHGTAGLLFFAVPFLCLQLALLLSGSSFSVIATGTGVVFSEFILFFGLALLCTMLCGNRVGAVILFALLNFLAPILQWIGTTLYQPLLYGVPLNTEFFTPWSPLMNLMEVTENIFDLFLGNAPVQAQDWIYLLICGGMGLALAALSLLLYRKRPLETAGDLISLRLLRPVFVVAFSLLVAVALFEIMGHETRLLVMLIPYLFIGFFGGRMLVEKRVNVFQGKAFLRFALLACVLFGSLGLWAADPMGISRKVPQAAQIRYTEIYVHPYANGQYYPNYFFDRHRITDPQHIAQLVQTHEKLAENRNDPETNEQMLYMTYYLTDGTTMRRYYPITLTQEPELIKVMSSWEAVFGMSYEELSQRLISVRAESPQGSGAVFLGEGNYQEGDVKVHVPELTTRLLEAMEKDCREGTMPQTEKAFAGNHTFYYLELMLKGDTGYGIQYIGAEINTANSTYKLLLQLYQAGMESADRTITEENVNMALFNMD